MGSTGPFQSYSQSRSGRARQTRPEPFQWGEYNFGQGAPTAAIDVPAPVSPMSLASSSGSSATVVSRRFSSGSPPTSLSSTSSHGHRKASFNVMVSEPDSPLSSVSPPPPYVDLNYDDLRPREILEEAGDALDEIFADKLLVQSLPALKVTRARHSRLAGQLEEYERSRGQFCHAVNCVLHTRARWESRVRQHGEHVQNLMERLFGRRFSTLTDPRSAYSPVQLAALEKDLIF